MNRDMLDPLDTEPTRDSFEMVVDRSRIAEFRRALGDELSSEFAPPTFVVVADQFDPAFDRRPRQGGTWPPIGGLPTRLHVEQIIHLARPISAGEFLTVRRHPPETWQRTGRRGGLLTFYAETTDLYDSAGVLAVRSRWVDVEPQHGHLAISTLGGESAAETPRDTSSVVVAERVSRTSIVMYVGVTGDFHPLHHDERFAVENGYPSVFAPGMFTMALSATAVRSEIPEPEIAALGGRFRAQVWPGDRLTAEVSPKAEGCAVVTRNQDNVVVFDGWAKRR